MKSLCPDHQTFFNGRLSPSPPPHPTPILGGPRRPHRSNPSLSTTNSSLPPTWLSNTIISPNSLVLSSSYSEKNCVKFQRAKVMGSAMATTEAMLCNNRAFLLTKPINPRNPPIHPRTSLSPLYVETLPSKPFGITKPNSELRLSDKFTHLCRATPQKPSSTSMEELDGDLQRVLEMSVQ